MFVLIFVYGISSYSVPLEVTFSVHELQFLCILTVGIPVTLANVQLCMG